MYDQEAKQKRLNEAAASAIAEAEERRRDRDEQANAAKEVGGREGPEPTRYGDWEKNGVAVDF